MLRTSGTNWLGKPENDQLQRVYGVSFPDKKEFAEWKHFQEQAAKRDHRKIGLEQVRVRARVSVRVGVRARVTEALHDQAYVIFLVTAAKHWLACMQLHLLGSGVW